MSTYTVKTIRMAPYLVACMYQQCQHVAYPGSCKSCFSHILLFGGKVLLIFPIIYKIAHLHNWPTWPNYLFDLCQQLSWMTCLAVLEGILRLFPQLALKFHWDKTCFFLAHIDSVDIEIIVHSNYYPSFWWLCRRLTRSTTPWRIKSGPNMSN